MFPPYSLCSSPRLSPLVAIKYRWQKALELLGSIETRNLVPDVVSFTSTMSACGRAGEWQVIFVQADQHYEFYSFSFVTGSQTRSPFFACARCLALHETRGS